MCQNLVRTLLGCPTDDFLDNCRNKERMHVLIQSSEYFGDCLGHVWLNMDFRLFLEPHEKLRRDSWTGLSMAVECWRLVGSGLWVWRIMDLWILDSIVSRIFAWVSMWRPAFFLAWFRLDLGLGFLGFFKNLGFTVLRVVGTD